MNQKAWRKSGFFYKQSVEKYECLFLLKRFGIYKKDKI